MGLLLIKHALAGTLLVFQKAMERMWDGHWCCVLYGLYVVEIYSTMVREVQNWYLETEERHHLGRPFEVDEDRPKVLLRKDSPKTTRALAEKMNCSHISIGRCVKFMAFVQE